MSTDQTADIDATVIEALRAQSRRYDVAIDGELVLSVLPNGVKTWTWVYDNPSDPHRKTLGIYPDMSLEDARKSLAAEKRSYSRTDSQEPEFIIRDGRIQSASPSSQWPIIIGAVIAMIAVIIVAYLILRDGTDNGTFDTMDDSPFATSPSAADIQLPTLSERPAEAIENHADTFATNTTNLDRVDDLATDISPPVTDYPVSNDGETPDNESLVNKLDQRLGDSRPTQPVATDDTTATRNSPASDNDLQASVPHSSPPTGNDSFQDSPPTRNENFLASAPPNKPAVSNDSDQAATSVGSFVENAQSELILDSRVARGNLATAVASREPVDDLGSVLTGNGEDWQTFYFFTELRSLSGQQVRHRWLYRNQVVAEVPFDVGEAWRWRVFSSKTFIPSMSGQWHVQVLLEDDTVIYNLPFSFSP